MLDPEFTAQFKELVAEYRRLSEEVKQATDDQNRKAIMTQMQDNLRRQNALREQFLNKGKSNV